MTQSGDSHGDMERFALDPDTADRLLSGTLDPEDAPHRYGEVASLLRLASGPTPGALDGAEAAVASVVGAIRSNPVDVPTPQTGLRRRLTAAIVGLAAALAATGSLAAANALPTPAQQAAADALAVVGVHVPHPSATPGTSGHEHPGAGTGPGHSGPSTPTSAVPSETGNTVARTGTPAPGGPTTTVNVSARSSPGAGADAGASRTEAPPGPAANPPSELPRSAPASGANQPSAAPASTSPGTRHAARPTPSGTVEGPSRGSATGPSPDGPVPRKQPKATTTSTSVGAPATR